MFGAFALLSEKADGDKIDPIQTGRCSHPVWQDYYTEMIRCRDGEN